MTQFEFEHALRDHYDTALQYCFALVAKIGHIEAEDLLQDALLKALRKYEQVDDPAKFKAWLFTIITRTHLSKRRLKAWKRLVSMEQRETHIPEAFSQFELSEDQSILLHALSRVSPKERAAFLLFEIGGFSVDEIRMIQQERSLSTIKSRLSRTRKKMRIAIDELEKKGTGSRSAPSHKNLHDLIHETTQQGNDALK